MFWLTLGLVLVLTGVLWFCHNAHALDPGVAWKIPYEAYPELAEIYAAFVKVCIIPEIPERYFTDTAQDVEFQSMRRDCTRLPQVGKYETLELSSQPMSRQFAESNPLYQVPGGEYILRYGCYRRSIPFEVEQLATEKISHLMARLGLGNRLNKLTDSRGSTYMPPGGFMEYHSNQDHLGGWRLYMHYLPDKGNSWFAYRHPFDGSYRRIADSNIAANMFRIRKKPKKLLWHAIYADTPRFSWGIWLPPELAQHLKTHGHRV